MTQRKTSPSLGTLLRLSKKTFLLIIVVVAVTLFLSALVSIILERNSSSITLPSIANLHTVGIRAYWDPNLQNQTRAIEWGTVNPGQSYNVTLYLQSISNVPSTLQMTTTNWTFINTNTTIAAGPMDSTPYINLTWTYDYRTLSPNETIQTTLTLTIDNSLGFMKFLIDNDINGVTMDIIIQANEK